MASRLLITPTKGKRPRGPVFSDPRPMMRQLSLRDCLSPSRHDSAGKPQRQCDSPEKLKRKYTARGTCGTFGGKRPPKKLHLKAVFEEMRDAHQVEMHEKKSETSTPIKDRAYQQFLKEMMPLETGASSRDRFRSVAQKWKSQMTSGQDAATDAAAVMAAENRAVV